MCAAALSMTLRSLGGDPRRLRRSRRSRQERCSTGSLVGSFVRCGAALPALFLCLFSVADGCELRPALLGAVLGRCLDRAGAERSAAERVYGRRQRADGAVLGQQAGWSAGDRRWSRPAGRDDELRDQRDRTARLAVAADRARVARNLDAAIGKRIGRLASDAAAAQEMVGREPDAARESLAAIETEGRRTLSEMREIVGTLRDESTARPRPSLADLDALMERFGRGRAAHRRGRSLTLAGGGGAVGVPDRRAAARAAGGMA